MAQLHKSEAAACSWVDSLPRLRLGPPAGHAVARVLYVPDHVAWLFVVSRIALKKKKESVPRGERAGEKGALRSAGESPRVYVRTWI